MHNTYNGKKVDDYETILIFHNRVIDILIFICVLNLLYVLPGNLHIKTKLEIYLINTQ